MCVARSSQTKDFENWYSQLSYVTLAVSVWLKDRKVPLLRPAPGNVLNTFMKLLVPFLRYGK